MCNISKVLSVTLWDTTCLLQIRSQTLQTNPQLDISVSIHNIKISPKLRLLTGYPSSNS